MKTGEKDERGGKDEGGKDERGWGGICKARGNVMWKVVL
jgi:hypothetical protein